MMNIVDFGKRLLETEDLDPVYVALHKMNMNKEQLDRWLLSYWCFYHCGVASHMSEITDPKAYWEKMLLAGANQVETPIGGRWPRASERRHFRGEQAMRALTELSQKGTASDIVDRMTDRDIKYGCPCEDEPISVKEIMDNVQKLRGFGPWIAFKVADMVERLGIEAVDFDEAAIFMFKDPTKAAKMLWSAEQRNPEATIAEIQHTIVNELIETFKEFKAPPTYFRPVGLQEVETILCKWKSHMNGHYPIGKDIREIRHGVKAWSQTSETAAQFLEALPKEVA